MIETDGESAGADFGIITIRPETYDSVKRIFGLDDYPVRDGYQWAQGTVSNRDGHGLTVVAGSLLDQGNLAAVGFVDSMLRAWTPRHLLVVDIGGGVKGREGIGLGDVVVHTQLHYYDHLKVGADRNMPRYTPLAAASSRLREFARRPSLRGDTAWHEWIVAERPASDSPSVLEGELLTGGALLSNGELLDRLLADHPKALAAEMEGAGGARAVLDAALRGPQSEFLVVRGISDYCNEPADANQGTREQWRAYAADAAAAFARAIVGESEDGTAASKDARGIKGPVSPVSRASPRAATGDPWPKREGDSRDGRQFFDLSFEIEGERCSIADLGETAREVKRLALIGRAGSGKTFAVKRTLLACQAQMGPVLFVEAEAWTPGLTERLSDMAGASGDLNWRAALDVILREASVDVTLPTFEEVLESGRRVTLGVDSINSATASAANVALEALDQAARQWADGLAVIVTDRNPARYNALRRWTVARTTELEDELIEGKIDERHGAGTWAAMGGSAKKLLTSPFFLDHALRGADPESHSRSEALGKLVDRLDPDARDVLAEITAIAYSEERRDLPSDALPGQIREALSDAGIVESPASDDGRLPFVHELFGDYFASRHLVKQADGWPVDELDAVSFSGERWKFEGLSADPDNFDAVTLAAEQMPRDAGDSYLRAVYDWNWRAAVDCLNSTDPVDGPFSEAARLVVLSLLVERCNDPVEGTRKRATRLLRCLPDPAARELVGARNAREAREIIGRREFCAEWFPAWRAIFCRDDENPWSEEETGGICAADTLHGWTVSYALKRGTLSPEACRQLIGIYQGCLVDAETKPTLPASIRWRTIHSLAAGDGEYLLPLLLSALDDDPYPWVRWGAARSLTELAARARDPERSAAALDALRERARDLPISSANEIVWAARYRDAVPHFPKLMEPLLDDLQRNVRGDVGIAQWEERVADLKCFWEHT